MRAEYLTGFEPEYIKEKMESGKKKIPLKMDNRSKYRVLKKRKKNNKIL